jgi:hypothetical protein
MSGPRLSASRQPAPAERPGPRPPGSPLPPSSSLVLFLPRPPLPPHFAPAPPPPSMDKGRPAGAAAACPRIPGPVRRRAARWHMRRVCGRVPRRGDASRRTHAAPPPHTRRPASPVGVDSDRLGCLGAPGRISRAGVSRPEIRVSRAAPAVPAMRPTCSHESCLAGRPAAGGRRPAMLLQKHSAQAGGRAGGSDGGAAEPRARTRLTGPTRTTRRWPPVGTGNGRPVARSRFRAGPANTRRAPAEPGRCRRVVPSRRRGHRDHGSESVGTVTGGQSDTDLNAGPEPCRDRADAGGPRARDGEAAATRAWSPN